MRVEFRGDIAYFRIANPLSALYSKDSEEASLGCDAPGHAKIAKAKRIFGEEKMRESKKKDAHRKEKVKYWLDSAGDDWRVAKHLFQKADYSYSLFFGHLTIEKMLKAIYVDRFNDNPPFTHRLVYLAEKASLELSEEDLGLLETVTDFNLEARYPDEKFTFKRRCTKGFTQKYLKKIEGMRKWLAKKIK